MRPKLEIRRSRGGAISSPTTTVGYLLQGGIAAALGAGCFAAIVDGQLVFALALVIPAVFLRDTLAWFLASPVEREQFLLDISLAGGAATQIKIGGNWSPAIAIALGIGSASLVSWAFVTANVVFLIAGLYLSGVFALVAADLLRGKR